MASQVSHCVCRIRGGEQKGKALGHFGSVVDLSSSIAINATQDVLSA